MAIFQMDTPDLVEMTFTVPNGTFTHDDGHVLCVRTRQWQTAFYVATFFATSYVAHAATIRSSPGDGLVVNLCNIALALFLPMSGLMRAVNSIRRFARRGSDLEKACRAGALCMVVRVAGWLPSPGDTINALLLEETWSKVRADTETTPELRYTHSSDPPTDDPPIDVNSSLPATHAGGPSTAAAFSIYRPRYAVEDSSAWLFYDSIGARAYVDLRMTKIHGTYSLPQGYGFAILPRDTCLRGVKDLPNDDGEDGTITQSCVVASTYSIAKALASLVQALAALTILIGHREDLIVRWGYASFHLTVLPYMFMTIFNFISNLCTADYDCLYMVESPVMEEAKARGGIFEGGVAATCPAAQSSMVTEAELQDWNGLKFRHVRKCAQELLGVLFCPVRLYHAMELYLQRRQRPGRTLIKIVEDVQLRADKITLSPPPDSTLAEGQQDAVEGTLPQHIAVEGPEEAQHFVLKLINRVKSKYGRLSQYIKSDPSTQHRHTCGATHSMTLLRFLGLKAGTLRTIHLLSSGRAGYIIQTPLSSHSFSRSIPLMLGSVVVDYWIAFLLLGRARYLENKAAARAFASAQTGIIQSLLALLRTFGSLLMSGISYIWAQCAVCAREEDQERTERTLYLPMCPPFQRKNDPQKSLTTAKNVSRKQDSIVNGMLIELLVSIIAIGLLLTFIGWRSHWYSPGNSSPTQKAIMLLWICEGVIGIFLPLLTVKEFMLIFAVFPYYMSIAFGTTPIVLFVQSLHYMGSFLLSLGIYTALTPLGLFIAPIWGFIIVGQMLVAWGRCVTLF